MSASSKQKLKLLYLYKMLNEQTDSEHGLSMSDILERLAAAGIDAERKGIYRDLDVLREFGLNITTLKRSPVEYTLERSGMTLAEITLLIDAVQGSKFLTQRMSSHLVNSIRTLASEPEREQLNKRIHVDGRIKSQNDSVFYNVDTIHDAMRQKRKVSFLYFKYDARLKRQVQHDGKPYVQTPVQVVFSDGFYYLITWSDTHEDFVRFRIDRMKLVQVSNEAATRNATIANYAYEDFALQSFGMFNGETVSAKLHVAPGAMDIIVDRFGTDIMSYPDEGGYADVVVTVRKSAQFFGWIAGTDGQVTIAGPNALANEYREWLRKLAG